MKETGKIDELMLTAFIDGELAPEDTARVVQAMEQDPVLRERVNRLRRSGDLMRLGFGQAVTSRDRDKGLGPSGHRTFGQWAASLVLVFVTAIASAIGGFQAGLHSGGADADDDIKRVVLHISKSDPAAFAAALEFTRKFALNEPAGSEIAVVANAGGLDLLRRDVSRFKQQIGSLIDGYENVYFIACANSIKALRETGVDPVFIEHVDTSRPAFDQIVSRLDAGWSYRKVESLMIEGAAAGRRDIGRTGGASAAAIDS